MEFTWQFPSRGAIGLKSRVILSLMRHFSGGKNSESVLYTNGDKCTQTNTKRTSKVLSNRTQKWKRCATPGELNSIRFILQLLLAAHSFPLPGPNPSCSLAPVIVTCQVPTCQPPFHYLFSTTVFPLSLPLFPYLSSPPQSIYFLRTPVKSDTNQPRNYQQIFSNSLSNPCKFKSRYLLKNFIQKQFVYST